MTRAVLGRFAFPRIDWLLLLPALALSLIGIITMHTFGGDESFAPRQLLWVLIGVLAYGAASIVDLRFLRRTSVVTMLYLFALLLLILLVMFVDPIQGARSWFSLGTFTFQPSDFAKLAVIALLAKYFSRRHVEIRNFQHILVSGAYAAAAATLVLIEPDFGTAMIIFFLWLGMVLVSGISKRHLLLVVILAVGAVATLWYGGFADYQRTRILTFLNPASDINGAGYNAYQATVAVGSGGLWGKGIGFGTQSKLRFLPEYQTDFIFAAFAEEWGFVGITLVLLLYALLFVRLVECARRAATNFDTLFTIGVAVMIASHVAIHAGINLGLLPITGTTIPFMSYGGSHLVVEFLALGVVSSLSRHLRVVARDSANREYVG